MRASTLIRGGVISFVFELHPEDSLHALGQADMEIEIITGTTQIDLGDPIEPHPDLIALAALMIVRPWCKRRLHLNTPVSDHFSDAAHSAFNIELTNVDNALQPRERGPRPGLAYSTGPDCLAAAVILGVDMPLFHFTRVRHPLVPNRATHLRSDVILSLTEQARDMGHEVRIARSDLEFLTRPFPTFANWLTMAVGAVLEAEQFGLGAVVLGQHIASAYLQSGDAFNRKGHWNLEWAEVFGAAGLDLTLPAAGITEVTTLLIARDHPLFPIRRSCLLGPLEKPCSACSKCLRKDLIDWYHGAGPFPWGVIRAVSNDRSVTEPHSQFDTIPQKHVMARLLMNSPDLSDTFLGYASQALKTSKQNTDWVEKYYPKAIEDHIPSRWRDQVTNNLASYLEPMSADDIRVLETWPSALQSDQE